MESKTEEKSRRTLRAYYKQKLCGGRGPLARAIDALALRGVFFAAVYLYFLSRLSHNTALALGLSAAVTGLLCVAAALWGSIRLDKFIQKERSRLREAYALKQLLLLPPKEYAGLVRGYARAHSREFPADCLVLPLQRGEPLGADVFLAIYRLSRARNCTSTAVFCPAPLTKEARALSAQTDLRILPQPAGALLQLAREGGLMPDDDALDAHLLAEIEREKEERRQAASPFVSARVKRYLGVAAGLFGVSFFARYALYYRLMAATCVSFAAAAWWLERAPNAHNADAKQDAP